MSFTSLQRPLTVVDQMGRRVTVPYPPQRIVSLVPSQTELLFDLGLGKQIKGVTKFCVRPPFARHKASVIGGTKNFDFTKIAACRPDLVIGNKEENYQEGVEQLSIHYPVWMSNIADVPGALRMIRQVGLITGTARIADPMAAAIAERFDALNQAVPPESAAYFIWRKPYMVAAAGTFINDLLRRAGFANVFGALGRYPEITSAQLAEAAPQRILLSSEPYPFQEKHCAELQEICPSARVELVDGEMFSWYGSRLHHAAAYLSRLR